MTILQKQVGDYHPASINQYVPACSFVSDVSCGKATRVSLGTPAVADTDALLNAASMDLDAGSAETFTTFDGVLTTGIMDAPYGRNVTATASGTPNATVTVTVVGKDYIGQVISENFTIASGATTGAGLKAFKRITSITHDGNASAAVTGTAGFGDVLGMPYKCVKVLSEEADGVVESTLGTHVGPVLTDPQTATTGDPRGTYNPTTTLDGSTEVTVTALFDNSVNSSGNGGFFGISHFSG